MITTVLSRISFRTPSESGDSFSGSENAGRLVEYDDGRILHDGARYGDSLPFAAER
jgi:hypothetical protein